VRAEEKDKGGKGDGKIDPSASSSRKQVSPRKTGLIRRILIFIHSPDATAAARPTGRKSVPEIPPGERGAGRGEGGGTKSGWQDYSFL